MAAGKPKICARCGNLVGSEDDRCYSCGLKMGSPLHGVAAVRRLLAKYGSTRSILAGFILLVYAAMVVLNGGIVARDEAGNRVGGLMFGFSIDVLVRCGASFPNYVANGQSWRLVTAMFLHGGLIHVAFNVIVLLQLGRLCELYFDARRTFVIFFVSGFVGMAASCLAGNFSVGASGAVMGLAGGVLAKARFSGGGLDRVILSSVGRWVVFIVILGFIVPRVDWIGHLVGLFAGAALGYFLIREGGLRPRVHLALFWASLVVTLVSVALGVSFCINSPPPYYQL